MMTLAFRCGVCRKELHSLWAVLARKPFPVCSACRLMVHHACLAQADPPVCRRCVMIPPPTNPSSAPTS